MISPLAFHVAAGPIQQPNRHQNDGHHRQYYDHRSNNQPSSLELAPLQLFSCLCRCYPIFVCHLGSCVPEMRRHTRPLAMDARRVPTKVYMVRLPGSTSVVRRPMGQYNMIILIRDLRRGQLREAGPAATR